MKAAENMVCILINYGKNKNKKKTLCMDMSLCRYYFFIFNFFFLGGGELPHFVTIYKKQFHKKGVYCHSWLK